MTVTKPKAAVPTADTLSKSLASTLSSITTSLSHLSLPPSSSDALPSAPESLSESFLHLLHSLKQTTTSLSLSFKPPITIPAAIQQLDKLSDQLGRLITCVVLLSSSRGALYEEWNDGVLALGEDIKRYLGNFQHKQEENGNEEYLRHTGIVWDAIDKLTLGLSRTENEAVGRKWKSQQEVMKDAWVEFKEFLAEQADGGEDDEKDDEEDEEEENDEWGGLGEEKLSVEETARTEAAKSLLSLHQILHATIPRYLPLLTLSPDVPYSPLMSSSSEIIAAFDTAISCMYPQQDEDDIEAALRDLDTKSAALVKAVRARLALVDSAKAEEAAACRSFLDRWETRVAVESTKWRERRLSLSSLSQALE
ncbi:cyclin-D1-binding protein 1, partial [Tremellales sp. Uapishka_1]